MPIRRGLLILGLICLGVFVLANTARQIVLPQPLLEGRGFALGQSYQLDTQINDDLAALAETVDLRPESVVKGDAALIGGTLTVQGRIDGSLTAIGETLYIAPDAQINGDAILLVNDVVIEGRVGGVINIRGENLSINRAALLRGDVFACVNELADGRDDAHPIRPCSESEMLASMDTEDILSNLDIRLPPLNIHIGNPGASVAGWLFSVLGALGLSGLSILAVVIFPRQISHMEESIRRSPRSLGGIGLMTFLLALGVTFALAVALAAVPLAGVILIPVYLIAALLFMGMVLAGWITIALLVGDLLVQRFVRAALPPLVTAAAGNFALVIIWHLLVLVPFAALLALLALALLASVGLGAAILTRMGTKPLHKSYFVQG